MRHDVVWNRTRLHVPVARLVSLWIVGGRPWQ
jgi:hypothetical protein